jgi:hypothetical protein
MLQGQIINKKTSSGQAIKCPPDCVNLCPALRCPWPEARLPVGGRGQRQDASQPPLSQQQVLLPPPGCRSPGPWSVSETGALTMAENLLCALTLLRKRSKDPGGKTASSRPCLRVYAWNPQVENRPPKLHL